MLGKRLSLVGVLVLLVTLAPSGAAIADEHGDCGDPYTPIYEIQGDGFASPYDGDVVVTEGVVTVDLQRSSELSGFFIQAANGDGDPATSDGLFVSHRDSWSPSFDPQVGDWVRIQGTIDEFFGNTQMGWLDEATICGSGTVKAVTVDARTFTAAAESYEGMAVRFLKPLAVTDTFNLHRFGEVWLGEKKVVEQPTDALRPGADADALAEDNMDRSLLLDDGSTWSNPSPIPFLREEGTLRLGDTVSQLTGAVNYSFGEYRIQPQSPESVGFKAQNQRRNAPNVGGKVVVGSMNTLNYWTTLGGRGASSAAQLEVQTEKLVAALRGMGADIIGLQEIENDPAHTPITTLVDAMNAAEGSEVWAWIGEVDHYNAYPIRNEVIYRTDRVEKVGDPMTIADPVFDAIPPGRTDPLGRPPVAQSFLADGEQFTVMVNHFKSKGCDGAAGPDNDPGDGQSCFNATRVAQAQRVLEFVADITDATGDPDVLVVGDLNSYLEEDPVVELESELTNLVDRYTSNPYTYNFFAAFAAPWIGRGVLDHALATESMAKQVTRTAAWHINADEPRFLDWFDTSVTAPGPYRSSDHDPVLVGLELHP